MARNPMTVDYSDLSMVKLFAMELALEAHKSMTVILRPGHTFYNIIHTANEERLLKDALVVFRTNGD